MKIRIGSRGSRLAVAQAERVGQALLAQHPSLEIDFHRISTTGDRESEEPLRSMGGKGVFVKEIEEALLRKEIDMAVHSMKDMPQILPAGLRLGPTPKREDPRDALISRFGELLSELPRGSHIGTSSPRRRAQILHQFKKRAYHIDDIRGNVDTRLKKLQAGQYDAIVLAVAGLKRLGLESEISEILEPDQMMPAPGQGCLALELRSDDDENLELLKAIKDELSDKVARAERSFLQAIGGDCQIPLAAYTRLENEKLAMDALLLTDGGEESVRVSETGSLEEPELVGAKLAGRLLYEGGSELLFKFESRPKP